MVGEVVIDDLIRRICSRFRPFPGLVDAVHALAAYFETIFLKVLIKYYDMAKKKAGFSGFFSLIINT